MLTDYARDGLFAASWFGLMLNWQDATALEGRYPWFGVLVAAELVLAGAGCWILHRRGSDRWFSWWVALVVAAHFVPLAWLLEDWSYAAIGVLLVGALMGGTLLLAARVAGALAAGR